MAPAAKKVQRGRGSSNAAPTTVAPKGKAHQAIQSENEIESLAVLVLVAKNIDGHPDLFEEITINCPDNELVKFLNDGLPRLASAVEGGEVIIAKLKSLGEQAASPASWTEQLQNMMTSGHSSHTATPRRVSFNNNPGLPETPPRRSSGTTLEKTKIEIDLTSQGIDETSFAPPASQMQTMNHKLNYYTTMVHDHNKFAIDDPIKAGEAVQVTIDNGMCVSMVALTTKADS